MTISIINFIINEILAIINKAKDRVNFTRLVLKN